MKKIIVAASPMVGIFWFGPNGLISFGEPARTIPSNGSGYKDSPYDHVDKWAQVQKAYPQFRNMEYFDVPRGRVLYVEKTRQYRIVSSAAICSNQSQVSAICRGFSIPMRGTELVQDMHYELNPVFDDDDEDDQQVDFDDEMN